MSEATPEPQPSIDRNRYSDFMLAHEEVPFTDPGGYGLRPVEHVYGVPRAGGEPEEVSHEQMLNTFHDGDNLDNLPREGAQQPARTQRRTRTAERPDRPERQRQPRARDDETQPRTT